MDGYVFDYTFNKPEMYLLKYQEELAKNAALISFIELVAAGKRPDGTYNRCREALETEAKKILEKFR